MAKTSVLRTILGTLAGLLLCTVVVVAVEYVGHRIFPPPAGMDPMDTESIRAHVHEIPAGSFAMVALAWALGTFAGSWLGCGIARTTLPAKIIGGLQVVGAVVNFAMIPHPAWVMVVGFLGLVGGAVLGGWLGAVRRASRAAA